ncbi:hypothetical protein H4R21_007113, partial [Coemansia helicoidea]
LHDCNGEAITSARMSELLGPFSFLNVQMVSKVYNAYFGCQPLAMGVSLPVMQRRMSELDQFRYWYMPNRGEGMTGMANFIARDDRGKRQAAARIEDRLLRSRVIPSPLLWCHLILLGCTPLDQTSSVVVNGMFVDITGKHLDRLQIATANGVVRMSVREVWEHAKMWVTDLTNFIVDGRRAPQSLDIADDLHEKYVAKCRERDPNASDMDPSGAVAEEMFRTHNRSRLFLGIRSSELKSLYKYLGCVVSDSMVTRSAVKYLKENSQSFIHIK